MLVTKRMSIVPTFKCTLNCKLCSNHIPEFKRKKILPDASVEEIKSDIDKLFGLFDKIEWLQFVGGEIFLHKGLAEIWRYAKKYFAEGKFDKLIIETNATISPTLEQINAIKEYGENSKVMISDYGEVSSARDEFVKFCIESSIPYVLKKYHGNLSEQHFGGWIDNTACCDLLEPDNYVASQSALCPQVKLNNMHVFKGKLHRCSNSLFLSVLGVCVPNCNDYVDLNSELGNLDKKGVIKAFYDYPRKSCHFCKWKDAGLLARYNAAEQRKE